MPLTLLCDAIVMRMGCSRASRTSTRMQPRARFARSLREPSLASRRGREGLARRRGNDGAAFADFANGAGAFARFGLSVANPSKFASAFVKICHSVAKLSKHPRTVRDSSKPLWRFAEMGHTVADSDKSSRTARDPGKPGRPCLAPPAIPANPAALVSRRPRSQQTQRFRTKEDAPSPQMKRGGACFTCLQGGLGFAWSRRYP